MASSTSSEFLVFMRHVVVRSRTAIPPRHRQFSTSPSSQLGETDKQHATTKKDKLDIQSEQVGKGQEARSAGGQDTTTSQSDSTNSAKKAKEEFPEAADNAGIGMQDERGAKGAHKG
ncbi:hypothetical protein E2P81_ATG06406 [Venturia nashicola]|uniref:Uncharacterized protein n=1 Tax=Venturia nashicola TaxID=86259 RepID=A0A4Z1NS32_9PEZI|nr:hypothetical protein E6O75_ATG06567 [Venturia nashicola]TLD28060.1 hypothetical protein E2P81_ATG06406 [Venturia nashicola]